MGIVRVKDLVGRNPVLRSSVFQIRRIRKFLGYPDPLVRGMDVNPNPDPSIIKQK
jgi:hypothetical protein